MSSFFRFFIIYFIESFDGELSAEILNILAISRLSRGQDKETFEIAINEFKKVYLKEKKNRNWFKWFD